MVKSERKRVPKTVLKITRSRTIEICGLEQSHVFEFKALSGWPTIVPGNAV
jgi:hypothetical protein